MCVILELWNNVEKMFSLCIKGIKLVTEGLNNMEIYGAYGNYLPEIKDEIMHKIDELSQKVEKQDGEKLYEHLIGRIKCSYSMIEKCQRKGLDLTPKSALNDCKDAIGIRIVCNFIDDIYKLVGFLKIQDWCVVVKEKDYVSKSKPNGYRSYHLIIKVSCPYPDINGRIPGNYYAEIQLRTIAMDSWASLEHELKYKHNIKNPEQIGNELKRCADQLASCDVQMQTIRQVIHEYD